MGSALSAVAMGYGKLLDFRGRSTRFEFWVFALWQLLLQGGFLIVNWMSTGSLRGSATDEIQTFYDLAHALPNIALTVRRLHDIDRTGWYILWAGIALGMMLISGGLVFIEMGLLLMWITFMHLVALCVVLEFAAKPGTVGANRFGPDPNLH